MKGYFISFLVLLSLLFVSCSKGVPTDPAIAMPEDLSFHCDKIPSDNGEYRVLQKIQLNSYTETGNLYAYRIYTSNDVLPPGYYADPDGWLYFYAAGADHSLSLGTPGNHRSIWTGQRSLSAEFSSSMGKLSQIITKVDVQIRHADNTINTISAPFRSERILGNNIIVNFQDGDTVSAGVEFNLHEQIGDIFVDGLYADHFMYRVNIMNASMQVTNWGEWHNSIDCEDIRKVILNPASTPALTANLEDEYTQFESYVVSRQGLTGADISSVYFHVQTGFHPQSLIYTQKTVGLGSNHYSIDPALMPYTQEFIPSSSNHKNRELYVQDQHLQAINSPDFMLYLNWGWSGQYGLNNNTTITDDPWDSEINQCADENGINYHSRITAFDLRWDNAPFPIQDHFFNPRVITDQNTGMMWLRIDNYDAGNRFATLSNQSNGTHRLQVRAVDLQNAIDPSPAEQYFDLAPFKPLSQRSGILIVDDSPNSTTFSPDTYVDNFYNTVVPNTLGNVSMINLYQNASTAAKVNPVMLQDYKVVLWHSDNPLASSTLNGNPDALLQYLSAGGKFVFSGTHKTVSTFEQICLFPELSAYFGFTNTDFCSPLTPNGIQNNTYFVNAISSNQSWGDMHVNTTDSFNSIVNSRKGLGAITYFEPNTGLNYVYALGCKPVNSPTYPPSQAQYDLYSSKYVAYMHHQGSAAVLVFGFPLSYMVQTDVASALPELISQLLDPIVKK